MSLEGNAVTKNSLHGSVTKPNTIHGKSAYEIAVLNGFEGTEAEWLESLAGNAERAEKAAASAEQASAAAQAAQERAESFALSAEIDAQTVNVNAEQTMMARDEAVSAAAKATEKADSIAATDQNYNPTSTNPQSGTAVAEALASQNMKLLKTIVLEEAVTAIETTFDKPLKEIYMVFKGTLDGLTADVTDCILACNTNSGLHYFFYKGSCRFFTTADRAYIAHAKEIVERQWETVFAGNTLGVDTAGSLQGLDAQSGNPRISYSTRIRNGMTRYVDALKFFVYNSKYSFAVGSTLEIYGVEGDEE